MSIDVNFRMGVGDGHWIEVYTCLVQNLLFVNDNSIRRYIDTPNLYLEYLFSDMVSYWLVDIEWYSYCTVTEQRTEYLCF